MVCCSVRSRRHRELDSSASQSSRVVTSSIQSAPQRQLCTAVDWTNVHPAPTGFHDVNRYMSRYSGVEYTAGGQRDLMSAGGHTFEVGDRRPFSGTDNVGAIGPLSDDDYHSPDSAYHSSHDSSSTTWNGGQGYDDQMPRQRWWSQVTQAPAQSKNHEKSPSWPVTQPSVLPPPAVNYRASSWTDNARTNNIAELCSQSPVVATTQVEGGLPPSPQSARRYFEEVAARLIEARSEFHPSGYASGNQNSTYHGLDFSHSTENSSTNYVSADCGKVAVVAGRPRSLRGSVGQECSPGPPPLPDTSPPRDPPPRLTSSSTWSASSDRLATPYNTALHRDVFDSEMDRQGLSSTGQVGLGMQVLPNGTRVEAFSETPTAQPHQERGYLVNGRRHGCENGCGDIPAVAAEGSHVHDKLSPSIGTIDEEDLRSRLDMLPANQSQTSVLRRLSQEYFGASRSRYGINPAGRMSLGSASSCSSISGNEPSQVSVIKHGDTNYQQSEFESPKGFPGSSVPGVGEIANDRDMNFVRARKTQLSLRKAFGIFDDFDVAEATQMKQLPVLTEDETPRTVVHGDFAEPSPSDDYRVKGGKGRRSSETEFHRQSGGWRNVDQASQKPVVNSGLAMQRSMSVGSTAPLMMVHGHRLSTASSISSSSGSTNGRKSSLDLSSGSSARSGDVLMTAESGDALNLTKTKSKTLRHDAQSSSDPDPALSYPPPWRRSDNTERLEVIALHVCKSLNCFYCIFTELDSRLHLVYAVICLSVVCNIRAPYSVGLQRSSQGNPSIGG